MALDTFITVDELSKIAAHPETAIFDCRYDLADPAWGNRRFLESHIPGAQYVDLEKDLSDQPDGKNGRHPLPTVESLSSLFSNLGIDETVQAVCYDDQGGAYAGRMWWSLQYLGHSAAAVLIGGYPAWISAGYPIESTETVRTPKIFKARPDSSLLIEADTIQQKLGSPDLLLIDSRAPERYRGEIEPWDPVAGHIPGSLNRFWGINLDEDQVLLSQAELKQDFADLVSGRDSNTVVYYCGSGVTSCLNLLAMQYAGLGMAKLYPGSWSEWCADENHPVSTGDHP